MAATGNPASEIGPLQHRLNEAVRALKGKALTGAQIGAILEAYAQEGRDYHGPAHALEMLTLTPSDIAAFKASLASPSAIRGEHLAHLVALAGFYHDCVYAGIAPPQGEVARILDQYVRRDDATGRYSLRDDPGHPREAALLADAAKIFGVKQGATLPAPKTERLQDEFLSTLVMMDQLERAGVPRYPRLQIAALIEASIPFRSQAVFAKLADRLKIAGKGLFSPESLENTMKASALFAKKDVAGLAGNGLKDDAEALRAALRNSWRLMPESNPRLRAGSEALNAKDFLDILQKTRNFHAALKPERLFHRYHTFPREDAHRQLTARARELQTLIVRYFDAKIVSAALVDAIARRIGEPQASLDSLVGDAQYPKTKAHEPGKGWKSVHAVLKHGRNDSVAFDIDSSPLAAFIVEQTGETSLMRLCSLARSRPDPQQMLLAAQAALGPRMDAVIDALTALARRKGHPERAGRLEALQAELAASRTDPEARVGSWAVTTQERSGKGRSL